MGYAEWRLHFDGDKHRGGIEGSTGKPRCTLEEGYDCIVQAL